jgi:hypothetical protein
LMYSKRPGNTWSFWLAAQRRRTSRGTKQSSPWESNGKQRELLEDKQESEHTRANLNRHGYGVTQTQAHSAGCASGYQPPTQCAMTEERPTPMGGAPLAPQMVLREVIA